MELVFLSSTPLLSLPPPEIALYCEPLIADENCITSWHEYRGLFIPWLLLYFYVPVYPCMPAFLNLLTRVKGSPFKGELSPLYLTSSSLSIVMDSWVDLWCLCLPLVPMPDISPDELTLTLVELSPPPNIVGNRLL